MPSIKSVVVAVVFVAAGSGLVFVGFEAAAYEHTIADREVTTDGTVTETDVWQLPDGNWTYEFTYQYTFDQRAEITAQDLEDVYSEEMSGEQGYTSVESGGEYSTERSARSAMEGNFEDDGSVIVYVDPFFPDDSSLSDATTPLPMALQYGGAVALALGLFWLARMARRVSA